MRAQGSQQGIKKTFMSTAERADHHHGWHNENSSRYLEKKMKFDGKKVDDLRQWGSKLRDTLSIYNGAVFNIL